MKIIVSHDVDHLSFWEHCTDLIIPKFFIRNTLEFLSGKITIKELFLRKIPMFTNRWHNIPELIDFNKQMQVPAAFFFGMNQGKGMSYKPNRAKKWIAYALENHMEVGVHGVDYQKIEDIQKEYETFKSISGLDAFGIRMHYLRNDANTLNLLSQAGYTYDSTQFEVKKDYRIGNMVELPLMLMDGAVCGNRKLADKKHEQAIEESLKILERAKKENIEYFTILFHDRYYNESFIEWKKWYEQLIITLKSEGYEFISFNEAVKEIKESKI